MGGRVRLQQFPKLYKLIVLAGDVTLMGISYLISVTVVSDSSVLFTNLYSHGGMFPLLVVLT